MADKATARNPVTTALTVLCAVFCILFSFVCIVPGGFIITPPEIMQESTQGNLEFSETVPLLFFVLLRATPGTLLGISVLAKNNRTEKALIRTAFILPVLLCMLPFPILSESRLLFCGNEAYLLLAALALLLVWIASLEKLGRLQTFVAMAGLILFALVILPVLYHSPFEGAGQGLNCSFLISSVSLWLGGMFAVCPAKQEEKQKTVTASGSLASPLKEPEPHSPLDDLAAFKELLDMGAITQEEYDAKK